MSVVSLSRRLKKVASVLQPAPRDTRLPYLVLNEDGTDFPGYEEHNQEHSQLARRRGIMPNVYTFDPDQDGIDVA